MKGLNYAEQQSITESVSEELRKLGHVNVEWFSMKIDGSFRINTDINQYDLNFYSHALPDFKCGNNGLYIDLDSTYEMVQDGWLRGRSILQDVVDITSPPPYEYGLLKLKYGLDKHHLFIPEFIKPKVREFHKKVRGGV